MADDGPSYPQVVRAELRRIAESRGVRRGAGRVGSSGAMEPLRFADADYAGVALSGGGIRSASFCLGVLQAFAGCRLLGLFDYLSTVSGGGYAGAWWSARAALRTPPEPFLSPTAGGAFDSADVRHVRANADYLLAEGPRAYLRIAALLLRGLLASLFLLLPYLLAAALLLLLVNHGMGRGSVETLDGGALAGRWPVCGLAAFLLAAGLVLLTTLLSHGGWPRWLAAPGEAGRARLLYVQGALLLAGAGFALLDVSAWLAWLIELDLRRPPAALTTGGDEAGFLGAPGFWSLLVWLGALAATVGRWIGMVAEKPWLRRLAPYLLAVLAPLALWLLALWLSAWLAVATPQADALGHRLGDGIGKAALFYLAALVVGALALLYLRLDVNRTSPHAFYRDQLRRTFLPVDAAGRAPPLAVAEPPPATAGGPYHLVNATANRDGQRERPLPGPAPLRRLGYPFVFAPDHSGWEHGPWVPTGRLETADSHLDLATAVAISGAATSTAMGEKSFGRGTTLLLALLNVRLGYWLPAPDRLPPAGEAPLERAGPRHFLQEALGRTGEGSAFVNLSDGGHFENLGVYALLRRRCRHIVVVDAEQDESMRFEGLAVLLRLAFVDLGIRIELDVADLRPDAQGQSRRHFALGRILYPEAPGHPVRPEAFGGELLYLKLSITGNEPEHLRAYRRVEPQFPHQSTGDQFYDETQFEAYRALGEKVGNDLLQPWHANLAEETVDAGDYRPAGAARSTADLFGSIRRILTPRERSDAEDWQLAGEASAIEREALGSDNSEAALGAYPELLAALREAKVPLGEAARDFALVRRQLRLIERLVLNRELDDPRARMARRNAGWMNRLRRWSQSDAFQTYWLAAISEHGRELQLFCELALDLRWVPRWWQAEGFALTGFEERSLSDRRASGSVWVCHIAAEDAPLLLPLQVAVAVKTPEGRVHFLRIRDTFRSMGLTERLVAALEQPPAIFKSFGAPAFAAPRPSGPQRPPPQTEDRLARVLARREG